MSLEGRDMGKSPSFNPKSKPSDASNHILIISCDYRSEAMTLMEQKRREWDEAYEKRLEGKIRWNEGLIL